MDRLLSDEEIREIDSHHFSPSPYGGCVMNAENARKECLAGQDAKTAVIVRKEVNEEWVKWIEDNAAYSYFTDGKRITINVAKWQARKKECGL